MSSDRDGPALDWRAAKAARPKGRASHRPGYKRGALRGGRHDHYWVAGQVVRDIRGFPQKTIRLPADADDATIDRLCQEYTARLHQWIDSVERGEVVPLPTPDQLVGLIRDIALSHDKIAGLENAARRAAELVRGGELELQATVDRLAEVAVDRHGIDTDRCQAVLAEAFRDVRAICGPDGQNAELYKPLAIDLNGADNAMLDSIASRQDRISANAPDVQRLTPLDLAELFALNIKPREMVLAPIIREKGLVMLYASRGTGKTHVGLGIAYAVATGTTFLKWSAPKARRVLLVDGEMPAVELRERLDSIVQSAGVEVAAGMFGVISGDLIEDGGVGNLADAKVQAELDPHLDGVDLLILDNLSSLTVVLRDNDADSWNAVQSLLLRLRRRGMSVLIIHHAGKGGDQRGTSRREDVLDTSISLRRPEDYVPTEGARFEVHIEKGRGIHGDGAKPFEARLMTVEGKNVWTIREIADVERARVAALLDDGMPVREIADETGLSKSKVGRLKKEIEAEKAAVS